MPLNFESWLESPSPLQGYKKVYSIFSSLNSSIFLNLLIIHLLWMVSSVSKDLPLFPDSFSFVPMLLIK